MNIQGPDQEPNAPEDRDVATALGADPDFGRSATLPARGSWQTYWIKVVDALPLLVMSAILLGCALAVLGWLLDNFVADRASSLAPGFRATTASGCVLLAVSIPLLRTGVGRTGKRLGRMLAVAAGVISLLVILAAFNLLPEIDWHSTGPLRQPSGFGGIVMLLLSLGLLTLDSDAPRYRWPHVLVPLTGFLLLFSIVASGYGVEIFGSETRSLQVSLTIALVLIALYLGYLALRPDRGIVGFLLSEGPGASMARTLIPTALAIPLFVALIDWLLGSLSIANPMAKRSIELVLIVSVLVLVVAVSSRRLQGFYTDWRAANAKLVEQSGVLTDMAEGVALIRISDGRFVLTNPQFVLMHGYAGNELIGVHHEVLEPHGLSPEEAGERDRIRSELREAGFSNFEDRARCKDGTLIWSRANVSVMNHPVYGEVFSVVASDITHEMETRLAKAKAESQFKEVFDTSPIGLSVVDDNLSFVRANPAFERITGYSEAELKSMTFADITHPDDLDADMSQSMQFFRGEIDGFEMEKRYVHRDGNVVWTRLTVSRMPTDESGRVTSLSIVEDITDRRETDLRIQHLAHHDVLTGLFNRRRFEMEMENALVSRSRREKGLALMVIDIDNFKFVNDTYGHSVGDQIICRVAGALQHRIRASDVVARLGGDEFVIILKEVGRRDAMKMADDLTEMIRHDVRVDGPEYSARVTVSIGLALAVPGDDTDDKSLLAQADKAMYAAKDGGRDRSRLYDPDDAGEVGVSFGWVEKIRNTLDNGGFELFAQPVMGLEVKAAPMYELFLRLRDPDGSIIAPSAFLPVAERHDLIQGIDTWVFNAAVDLLESAGGPDADFQLCVNLSGRSVGDPRLVDNISKRLEATETDPGRLVFEVTETSAIGNIGLAQEFAATLDELGCQLALDDFGTGFATFSYLKHIVCDYLKIDGEFVRNLIQDPTNRLVVQALVTIARGMEKQTVAEQVEDRETLDLLREFGVDFVQGHFTGRPKPLGETDFTVRPVLPQVDLKPFSSA